jgi:hypothetical protein
MMAGWISERVRRVLAPTALAEHHLGEWLDGYSESERKAFWAAVALMDRVVTVDQLLAARGGAALAQRRSAAGPLSLKARADRYCERCGAKLPDQETGRPRRFCAPDEESPGCRPRATAKLISHLRAVS